MDSHSTEMDLETEALSEFLSKYPAYKDTMVIDSLRREEYPHLDEKGQACLDYTGVGLFSSSQKSRGFGPGFTLVHTSSNLATHAMYVEEGSAEGFFRKRVLRYLNLDEDDYYLVFTANAFSAFKLLGTSYPFHQAPNLILSYNHRCENADALRECSSAKSACVQNVDLSFPWCNIDTEDLRRKLQAKKKVSPKVGMKKGLFAFPYSSRVTGGRNSSKWIPTAQQDGWHVLLDVTSVDAKMLDSLGLSLFLPEFIICSFYNVFGADPTGLGCLAIKKSVLKTLGDSSRARAIGMVSIVNKRDSSLISSSLLLSAAKQKNEQENGSHLQKSMTDSQLRSPKGKFSLEPDLSADLGAIDTKLCYQSNSDSNILSQSVPVEDRGLPSNLASGKWSSCAGSSQMLAYDAQYGVYEGQKGVMGVPISDGIMDTSGNASANISHGRVDCESMSFALWVADQAGHNGSPRLMPTREHDERDLNFLRQSRIQSALPQDDICIDCNWQSQVSEVECVEPSFSHRGYTMRAINGHAAEHVDSEPSTSRNLKGIFYGDAGYQRLAHHTSLRRLFRRETIARVAAYLQRACQGHTKEVLAVSDWVAYYNVKAKGWSSASSNASDLATSSQRFGQRFVMEEPLERETSYAKAAGDESVQNRVAYRGLDHADMLGYKRIAVRLRSLVHWLMSSLSRLQHPPPNCSKLVKLCSQMSLADRGSTVAFTLLDSSGEALDLMKVQMLGDRNNISIGTGVIEGTLSTESLEKELHQEDFAVGCVELSAYKCCSRNDIVHQFRIPVLYVSLGFLNNFSDVYRLWRFICRFLDPLFVDRELWHYQALNQETIEI